uniref:Extracellular solute-binding protein family 3 n=1 Tax=Cyanothece sp. (strain PCC 7425 / ATCC 29141) TaxID=395961 RepID=B8HLA8_CYAP4
MIISVEKPIKFLAVVLGLLALTGCAGDAPPPPKGAPPIAQQTTADLQGTGRLATILNRGQLICGVSGELPGFSFVDQQGNYAGLDVDVCRAIAAALFDDPEAVEFRNLNAKERFTALQTGEIDILSRNTTLTMSRDTAIGIQFAPVVFYDGQGIMVRNQDGIRSLKDLQGKSICLQTGTTHEQNLTDQTRKLGIDYQPVIFEDINTMFATYAQGRCQAVSADRSGLISRRTTLPNPNGNEILPDVLSKEPLAPAVAKGDPTWSTVVEWIIYSLIEAEELGITTQNIESKLQSADPTLRRFLGREGNLGHGLGLSNDFAVRIIKGVGNYGEIYDRNLGPNTLLNLERGLNQQWSKGGLLYSPPFR